MPHPGLFRFARRLVTWAAALAAVVSLPFAWVHYFERPSLDRDWTEDQREMPRATIEGDLVTIVNVRNFSWRPDGSFEARYERRTYDLRKLDSGWFVVERFGDAWGVAHTFLSFGFGEDYVAISVEIRKERGEEFSPLKGLFRQYEIMYVVADERDALGLRTNIRRDPVYLYPSTTPPEYLRKLFVGMLESANALAREPEFYNTVTNNCTTTIVDHVNQVEPRIHYGYKVLFPAYSDQLAYDLKLIPHDRPFAQVQTAHRIDARAQDYGLGTGYSQAIRRFPDRAQ